MEKKLNQPENPELLKGRIQSLLNDWYKLQIILVLLDISEQEYKKLIREDTDFAVNVLLLTTMKKNHQPSYKIVSWDSAFK